MNLNAISIFSNKTQERVYHAMCGQNICSFSKANTALAVVSTETYSFKENPSLHYDAKVEDADNLQLTLKATTWVALAAVVLVTTVVTLHCVIRKLLEKCNPKEELDDETITLDTNLETPTDEVYPETDRNYFDETATPCRWTSV